MILPLQADEPLESGLDRAKLRGEYEVIPAWLGSSCRKTLVDTSIWDIICSTVHLFFLLESFVELQRFRTLKKNHWNGEWAIYLDVFSSLRNYAQISWKGNLPEFFQSTLRPQICDHVDWNSLYSHQSLGIFFCWDRLLNRSWESTVCKLCFGSLEQKSLDSASDLPTFFREKSLQTALNGSDTLQ